MKKTEAEKYYLGVKNGIIGRAPAFRHRDVANIVRFQFDPKSGRRASNCHCEGQFLRDRLSSGSGRTVADRLMPGSDAENFLHQRFSLAASAASFKRLCPPSACFPPPCLLYIYLPTWGVYLRRVLCYGFISYSS